MGFIQVYNGNLKHVATKDRKEVFMSPYANLRGNSPVVGYEIEATRITVWFRGGKPYSYSYNKAGRENVEEMKRLAKSGAGLSAYITRNVRFLYD